MDILQSICPQKRLKLRSVTLSEWQAPGINDASHCAVAAAHVAAMEGVTGLGGGSPTLAEVHPQGKLLQVGRFTKPAEVSWPLMLSGSTAFALCCLCSLCPLSM